MNILDVLSAVSLPYICQHQHPFSCETNNNKNKKGKKVFQHEKQEEQLKIM
jgi:hypothetical protein